MHCMYLMGPFCRYQSHSKCICFEVSSMKHCYGLTIYCLQLIECPLSCTCIENNECTACLEWAVSLACGYAACNFLSVKVTCSNVTATSKDRLQHSAPRTLKQSMLFVCCDQQCQFYEFQSPLLQSILYSKCINIESITSPNHTNMTLHFAHNMNCSGDVRARK